MIGLFKKIGSVVFDASFGLARQYHEKTLQLVKLEGATFYVNGVKALRKLVIAILLMNVYLAILAVAIVLVPVLLVLFSPLSYGVKIGIVAVLGVIYTAVPFYFLSKLFSEKAWLELSKSNEILSNITNGHNPS